MTAPSVCIVLYTYEDGERLTAAQTLRAALEHITYSGPLSVHIADDGSVAGHVDGLRELAGGYDHIATVGSTNAQRGGYGRSHNIATQATHGAHDVFLALEDDWELVRPLDLDPLVRTFDDSIVECIRLGYLGFTQTLVGELFHTEHLGTMMYLAPESPEPHVWTGHPRLETVQYQQRVGAWPEGLAAGATEFEVAHRDAARRGVAWPLDLIHPRGDLFVHTGAHELGELVPGGWTR